ncbi:MAG: hypothetical protein QOD06_3495 [Candidatus Binatota bacterium]|jgi:hypothetical protein|nr:hypothetical protein [Candidatus Binatota bacterium]
MADRLENGKHWIEEKLGEIAAQIGLMKDNWRQWSWEEPATRGEGHTRSLVIDTGKARKAIAFSEEELSACADPSAAGEDRRLRIESRLREALRELSRSGRRGAS